MSEETKILQCGQHDDEQLKARLAADAAERGASLNSVAVEILAAHFDVEFEGSGRRSPGFRGSPAGTYRMPRELWVRISNAATAQDTTKRAVVEAALREHYELAAAA